MFFGNFTTKRKQLKELDEIIRLMRDHVKELKKRQKKDESALLDVTTLLIEENIDLYRSLRILNKEDLLVSCVALARSILENSINLQYIYKADCEKRADNFMLFSGVKMLRRLKKSKNEFEGKKEMVEWMEKEVSRYKPSGKEKNHWDGKTIKEVFKEVGAEKFYDEWYSRLSGYIHSGYKSGRDINEERPYNEQLKKVIFRDVFVASLEALRLINEKHDLLEGGVIIMGHPNENSMTFFSINNKAMDRDREKIDEIFKNRHVT